ncbi:uncharacterized protein LOC144702245 isoform X2 [Wolffia australiana]
MSEEGTGSSGEEDGDADWRAAINSVATVNVRSSSSDTISPTRASAAGEGNPGPDDEPQTSTKAESRAPKLYQLRAQKLIDEILDTRLEMVSENKPDERESHEMIDGGVRLFSKSSRGIVCDPNDRHLPSRQRPRIIPSEEVDEKSKKFKRRVRSVSIDGDVIISSAVCARDRALAKSEARDAARKAASLLEEERIAELKKQRGEKWLPSIAREMQARIGREKTTAPTSKSKS